LRRDEDNVPFVPEASGLSLEELRGLEAKIVFHRSLGWQRLKYASLSVLN
jgi:hypothetical protein